MCLAELWVSQGSKDKVILPFSVHQITLLVVAFWQSEILKDKIESGEQKSSPKVIVIIVVEP